MTNRVLGWMEVARWAASGGNAQPWNVAARENGDSVFIELTIDSVYQAHPSPMDVDGLASTLALGCIAKNFEYVAGNDGYRMILCRAENTSAAIWNGKVKLQFQRDSAAPKPFTNSEIISRVTNRLRFRKDGVPKEALERFREIVRRNSQVHFVEVPSNDPKMANRLIPLLAKIERVRWRNRALIDGLLEEIAGPKEDIPTAIPAKQLGLSGLDSSMLLFFKKTPSARGLFRFGVDTIPIRRAVHDFCAFSDRVCFMETKLDRTPLDFERSFEFGRTFQELWLEANRSGIAFQPLGIPLIALGLWRGRAKTLQLSEAQEKTLADVSTQFEREFGIDFRNLVMGFRIGIAKQDAGKAPRKLPVVSTLEQ